MLSLLRILHDDHEEENANNDGTKNIIIKVACLIFLLGMAIGFGFMPYFITSCRKSNKFLSLSNAFSAGIFLGMGLFHILPESAELLEKTTEFPLAYICCFISYALILFVEKIAFNSHSIVHAAHCHEEAHFESHDIHGHGHSREDHEHHQHCHGKQKEGEECFEQNENKEEIEKKEQILVVKINNEKNHENSSSRNIGGSSTVLNKVEEENNEKNSKVGNPNVISKGGITSYLLLMALGFHGLFEGISLGIQSNIRGTLFLFLAIALHKWAASLTLGISFVKSAVPKKQFIIMILIFAFITPIGIALGIALTSLSSDTVAGIFLSISFGIFIYIACSEVVIDDFASPEFKYPKFLCFLLGAAVVIALSLVEFYTETGHNHDHHEHEHEH